MTARFIIRLAGLVRLFSAALLEAAGRLTYR